MRIAIATTGGDAPGLNAVIRGAVAAALSRGHEIFGIRNGFSGLLRRDELVPFDVASVDGIERLGGTILGAASDGAPFGPEDDPSAVVAALDRYSIDAVVLAGGDGSMGVGHRLTQAGVPVVGVPKTIDRDVVRTYISFGHITALQTASDAVDRLHSTTESHNRLMVVEVMGRDVGWLALYTALSSGASMLAIPELPYDLERYAEHMRGREARGHRYHIMVVAEGARAKGGEPYRSPRTGRYGGVAEVIAAELSSRTGKDARAISLGHLLRGGAPTVYDRVLGLRFGAAAISTLCRGESGVMVAFCPPGFETVPLEEVAGKVNPITADAPEIETALSLDISFGADPSDMGEPG